MRRDTEMRGAIGAAAAVVALAVCALAATQAHAVDNLPPQVTAPASQTIDEDATLTFSVATGNEISAADLDAGSAQIRTTLTGNFGKVSLDGATGLSFSNGDGADDVTMTFDGTLADTNAALDGLTFEPDANHNDVNGVGTATLTIDVNDLGNTGDGGPLSDNQMVTINVNAVNDAPVNRLSTGLGTYRNVAKVLSSANLNAIGVNDNDGPNNQAVLEVALRVSDGTLTLGSTAGLTFTVGGNGLDAMTFRGTLGDITSALNGGVTFAPPNGFTGVVDLEMTTDDMGNTGSGGPLGDSDSTAIRVDQHEDTVYWSTSKNTLAGIPGGIGRAELDGGGGAHLITGPETNDNPLGTAIDVVGGRIYWSITPVSTFTQSIYSASLDGTDKQLFLDPAGATAAGAKLNSPFGLAIDQETRRLYWANNDNNPAGASNRGISYISLDDPASGGFIPAAAQSTSAPRGLALDLARDRAYYTNSSRNSLAFVPLPGAGGTSGTLAVTGTVSQPQGIAIDLDSNRLFWTNGSGDTAAERLKVATLNPPGSANETNIVASTLDIGPSPGGGLRAPAIDPAANRIYYANGATNRISYANLDGTGGGNDVAASAAVVNSPDGVSILKDPEPMSAPTVSGTAAIGSTLTCAPGTWKPDAPGGALYRMPANTSLEWTRDGSAIPGATDSTYTPDDAGEYRCVSKASNFAGATSLASAAVTVPAIQAPDTLLDIHPKPVVRTRRRTARVTFRFSSTVSGSTFRCKLDKAEFKPCSSPRKYRVRVGRHRFTVIAVSTEGAEDPTPAAFRFRVRRKR